MSVHLKEDSLQSLKTGFVWANPSPVSLSGESRLAIWCGSLAGLQVAVLGKACLVLSPGSIGTGLEFSSAGVVLEARHWDQLG